MPDVTNRAGAGWKRDGPAALDRPGASGTAFAPGRLSPHARMPTPLRVLFVAEAPAAVDALVAARAGGPVQAQLAPTGDVLRRTLVQPDAADAWDAVVFVPGGPVEEAEVAVFVPDGVPLFVVADEVPLLLAGTAAEAVDAQGLAGLHARLAAPAPEPEAPEPEAPAVPVGAGPTVTHPSVESPPGPTSPPPVTAGASADALADRQPEVEPVAAEPHAPPAGPHDRPDARDEAIASLADHLAIGLYRSSPDGRILYANPALARLLGVASVAELQALDVRTDLGYPRDAFVDEVGRAGEVRNLVVSWTLPSGALVHTRENARSVLGPDGVVYYEGTVEDVTAEVEARHEEQTVARRHQAVVGFAAAAARAADVAAVHDAAATAVLQATAAAWSCLVVRSGGRNRIASAAGDVPAGLFRVAEDLAGYPLLPRSVAAGDPSELDVAATVSEALAAAGVGAVASVPVHGADGPSGLLVWGRAGAQPATPAEVRGVEALAWHVGAQLDRADALAELRDTEASLAVIAERTPHVLYRLRHTPDGGVYEYLSPGIEALTGFDRAELDARGGIRGLVEHVEVLQDQCPTADDAGPDARYHAVYRMATAAGPRWVEDEARPWLDAAGRPVGSVGVLHDVTERRDRERQLAEAAQTALDHQRALVDLATLTGPDALRAPAAAIAAATLGADDVSFWLCEPGEGCRPLYAPPADQGGFEGALSAVGHHLGRHRTLDVSDAAADPRVGEMGLVPFVEAYGLGSLLVAPVRRGGRVAGVVAVHRSEPHDWDASEAEFAAAVADSVALALEREDRDQAVAALHASEQRYRVLAEMTSDYAFATRERDGRTEGVEWATGACARISGYTLDELAAPGALRVLVHPDSRDAVRTLGEHQRELGEAHGEVQIVTQSGATRWVDHHVRVGETAADGSVVVYHSGQDVTERKAAEAALVGAREAAEAGRAAAERINRLKSSFLANMSHEVRTPLTGILGFAEVLAAEVADDQRPFVRYIERNGHRLLDTLNAVLDLSQLEAGEYHAAVAPVRLAAAVREAAGRFEAEAADKGLRFDLEADPDVAAAVDPAALVQVAGHLVSNAVKFTETGGVLVAVEGTPDQAVLRVADTGVGISAAFLPSAFEAFRQEGTGHDRSHEGSGLGLAVVHRLVAVLGGHIEVESERPGGTIVTVTFPRVAVPGGTLGPRRADAWTGPTGDGARTPPPDAPALAPVAPSAAPAPGDVGPAGPAGQLGTPFDLSFLTAPAEAAAPSPPDSPPMFDFRFGRSAAPSSPTDPAPSPPAPEPAAPPAAPPTPRPAAPAPTPASAVGAPPARWSSVGAPAAEPRVTGPAPSDDDPVMIVRARPDVGPSIPEAAPAETAEVVAEAADARPSVLVVEDNNDTRMLLDRILGSVYNVTSVGDARSALLAMNDRRFAGLVLDINLGGKETGADVLRIARSLPDYGGVFAIALTAYALPGDRERLLESGFNEYISKPFTRQSLMDALAAGVQA